MPTRMRGTTDEGHGQPDPDVGRRVVLAVLEPHQQRRVAGHPGEGDDGQGWQRLLRDLGAPPAPPPAARGRPLGPDAGPSPRSRAIIEDVPGGDRRSRPTTATACTRRRWAAAAPMSVSGVVSAGSSSPARPVPPPLVAAATPADPAAGAAIGAAGRRAVMSTRPSSQPSHPLENATRAQPSARCSMSRTGVLASTRLCCGAAGSGSAHGGAPAAGTTWVGTNVSGHAAVSGARRCRARRTGRPGTRPSPSTRPASGWCSTVPVADLHLARLRPLVTDRPWGLTAEAPGIDGARLEHPRREAAVTVAAADGEEHPRRVGRRAGTRWRRRWWTRGSP